MSDGKDGLWDENVGPSCYAKSQGQPVKLWGFLANGRLHIHVLAPDGNFNAANTTKRKTDIQNTTCFVEAVAETVVIYSKSAETVRKRCGSGWESPASWWKRWNLILEV